MTINPADIQLTPDQQLFIAKQAERSGRPWPELLQSLVPAAAESTVGETAYEAFLRSGYIGCCEGLPADLSTNPAHMQGFGE